MDWGGAPSLHPGHSLGQVEVWSLKDHLYPSRQAWLPLSLPETQMALGTMGSG